MEELVKGFVVQHSCRYILEDAQAPLRERMSKEAVARAQQLYRDIEPSSWRPRAELVGVWQSIVDVTEPHEDRVVFDALAHCGERTGEFSTNTFFRLLMKILTPRMFASRFSEFYKRDQQGGEGLVKEIGSNHVILGARDIKGYNYFAPITVGFARVPFRGMGLKNVRADCPNWSLKDPGPNEVEIHIHWD